MNKTIIIAGGTGLVGTALTQLLVENDYEVIILTRNPAKVKPVPKWEGKVSYAEWDVNAQTIDLEAFAKADGLVNLAGAGVVDKPWTDSFKMEIIDSRVSSGKLLVKAMEEAGQRIKTVVNASALGWYGADEAGPGRPFVETDAPSTDFLGDACRQWEDSIAPVASMGKRLVICRIGIVLSNDGGALAEFKKPLMFRVAGVLGTGRQMVSWIHIKDLCGIIKFALETETVQGIFNTAAPNPVTNRSLNTALAKAMYGNAYIAMPVPTFVLKMMLGERSIEVLKSATISAEKIQQAGYQFKYPTVEDAFTELCSRKH